MSLAGQRALARLFGLEADTDAPPAPPDDGTPEFDGGVRDPEPAPVDPEHDHGQLIADLLREGNPGVLP